MICIYWKTKDYSIITSIKKEFSISGGITVNGENEIHPTEDELLKLKEYEKKGFLQLRFKNNEKN